MKSSSTETLVQAALQLSCDVKTDDGVASAALREIAERLREQQEIIDCKEDFILMPKRLTAENGAKALLMGEFSEKIPVDCPFCLGIGEDEEGDECTECGGSGSDTREVQIRWTNIKKIYAMAVKHFAGK